MATGPGLLEVAGQVQDEVGGLARGGLVDERALAAPVERATIPLPIVSPVGKLSVEVAGVAVGIGRRRDEAAAARDRSPSGCQ